MPPAAVPPIAAPAPALTTCQAELCALILAEFYGELVEAVGMCLARHGPSMLRSVVKSCRLPVNQVKKALAVLIQHNMVTFSAADSSTGKLPAVVYTLDTRTVLSRPRHPQFIYAAKRLYGPEAELIVEEVLRHGQVTTNQIISSVCERLKETLPVDQSVSAAVVFDKLTTLADNRFIRRCPTVIPTDDPATSVPTLHLGSDREQYTVPDVNLSKLDAGLKRKRSDSPGGADEPLTKRSRPAAEGGEDVYWRLNTSRFHEHMRDQTIVAAIGRKYDKTAAEIVRVLLKKNEARGSDLSSRDVATLSFNEIVRELPAELNISRAVADQWLKILVDTAREFISWHGDRDGGIYMIDFPKAYTELCAVHVESVIQERLGAMQRRMFRVLLEKQRLEEEQVLALTMSSDKELLRRLFVEQFITVTEVPRAQDLDPRRTICLFSVNLHQVARTLLDQVCKALSNLISRRRSLSSEHEALLTQAQRLEAILAQLDPTDISLREEYEEQISPAERAQLNKYKNMTKKLELAELQLDDTMFVLTQYLDYCHSKHGSVTSK